MAEGTFIESSEVYEVSGYVRIISERAAVLERAVFDLEAGNLRYSNDVKKIRIRAMKNINEIKDDVEILKNSVGELQMVMVSMIGQMKNTLKNDDFSRFEKRVDLWAPENLVNRPEAIRLLKQL
jgi:hypothetical protein